MTTAPLDGPSDAPWVLRPGARVLRRDRDHLQVGLEAETAVVVPDTPEHRALLRAWSAGEQLADLATHPLGRRLADAGLVVDARGLRAAPPSTAPLARHAAAAAVLEQPSPRTPLTPHLHPYGGPPGRALAHRLESLLDECGVVGGAGTPAVGVLIGVGQPPRTVADAWLRAGLPHLVVGVDEGRWTAGPLVEPTRTACLRCLDAHRAEEDPCWPLLVEQCGDDAGERADGAPAPVDPALAALTLGWAARDLLTWARGGRPATWSTTVRLATPVATPRGTAPLETVTAATWRRHPACGCSWDLAAA
ncbi:MAG: hypothetical protein Q8Q02_07120 [Nocardioides sp.]|nr:hypothetical protein [Nocardioides sp.]